MRNKLMWFYKIMSQSVKEELKRLFEFYKGYSEDRQQVVDDLEKFVK